MMYDLITRALGTFAALVVLALGGVSVVAWRLVGLLPLIP